MAFPVRRTDYRRSGENIMRTFLIAFTTIVFLAGAAVDSEKICNRLFPETRIVEYRREVKPGDTLWDICGEIATDKEARNG